MYSFDINPTYESGANGLSSYERAGWSNSRFYLSLSQSNRKYTDYRAADGLRIRNSQFEDRQTQVNFGLKVSDRHTLEGRYQYFSVLDAGVPGAASFPKNALARYPDTSRILADMSWTWRPHTTWLRESSINAYYQPVKRNVELLPNTPPSETPNPVDSTKLIRMTPTAIYPKADHRVTGARWQNDLSLGRHRIVAGIEGWQKHMTSDRTKIIIKEIIDKETENRIGDPTTITIKDTPVPESWQSPVGFFAEDAFDLGKRAEITLGSRIDHIHTENRKAYLTDQPPSDVLLWDKRTDNDISWSFVGGGIYKLFPGIDVNLTLARSFRSPTLEERYLYADLGGKVTVGDPEINSEKGTFVEGGISVTAGPARLKAQTFLNSITDMVILNPGGTFNGKPADVYTNAGKALIRGFEVSADWIAHPKLLVQADVSYIRGTDEKYDNDLPSMPPAKAHMSFRWSFTKNLWLEPLVTFVDRQDKVAPGERTTPGYGTVDISAGKSILKTGAVSHDLVVGVKNVGDKLYRDHLTISRGYEMYGIGRSFFVSWKMNLDHSR
ncbi:TonB-dependent receptor [bacterium]|nr:TonB-dependent receptor [bacterium]